MGWLQSCPISLSLQTAADLRLLRLLSGCVGGELKKFQAGLPLLKCKLTIIEDQ